MLVFSARNEGWISGRRIADHRSRSSLRLCRKVLDRAMHFALEGTARQAKFAARLVAYSKKADELTPDLSEVSPVLCSPLRSSSRADSLIFFLLRLSPPLWPTTTTSSFTLTSPLSRRSLVQHQTRSRIRASWSPSSFSTTLPTRTRT